MTVKKLVGGYWLVQFNQNQFVQWPIGCMPRAEDTFGFSDEDKEDAAARAYWAVMELAKPWRASR